jgi:hypothetical protein
MGKLEGEIALIAGGRLNREHGNPEPGRMLAVHEACQVFVASRMAGPAPRSERV